MKKLRSFFRKNRKLLLRCLLSLLLLLLAGYPIYTYFSVR